MTETSDRAAQLHVVLGAAGGTGSAVVRELVGQGKSVRAVTRRGHTAVGDGAQPPASYQDAAADVNDRGQLRRALEDAAVVYQCAQPAYTRWPQEFPAMNRGVIDAAASAGAKLVFADNLYMYGPGASPMREDTPQRATDRKGALRIRLAADLLARHERGEVEVAIGRSADYFGPHGVNTGTGERGFGALVAGKAAAGIGSVDMPHTFSYLPDLARAMVVLGDRDEAAGRTWHLPVTDPITVRELMERAASIAGVVPKVRVDGPLALRLAGLFVPMAREARVVLYQWTEPFVSDWSAFEAAFGPFQRTPLDDALATTVAWWRTEMASRSASGVTAAVA